jgi:FtsP/CotA-like multicopper oxidase with cupredoxin domain
MVRICLMARPNFHISRRTLLGGLGAGALCAGLPRMAVAAGDATVLQARAGTLMLRPGQPETPVSILSAPAPLRFKRGASPQIAFQNGLPAPAVINWHGLDGVPVAEPLTAPAGAIVGGATTRLEMPLRHAGTLFGDLALFGEGPSRALPLIVEESEAPPVDRDEIVLIEDYRLRSDGTAVNPGSDPKDAAAIYAVNGAISPDIAAHSNQRLRLRLINACQRHVIAVKIEGLDARVMALDSQPAEPFLARNGAVVLAPGGRADVVVDVTLPPGSKAQVLLHDGKEARPVARLAVSGEPAVRSAPLPPAPPLPSNGLPVQLELKGAQRFELALAGNEWVEPAKFATSGAPAFKVKQGRIVVLALTNRSNLATVAHLHGHHLRLLDRLDDGWKPYWLDTLAVAPGQTERVAFAAEHAGRWLIESTATDWSAPKLLRWYSVE